MPVITWDDLAVAVTSAFTVYWASRTPIADENDRFDAASEFQQTGTFDEAISDMNAYVRISIQPVGETTVNGSINEGGTYQRTAVALFEVYVREGTATGLANSLLEDLTRFLRRGGSVPHATIANVLPITLGTNGVWFQRNVTADLTYWTDLPLS